ncbi:hypothetical protein MIND_00866800 [Mycena indigotica]|uniref:Uncharacterized protein n=1 Tax=Mycena indigotica TaxID=2126181 RepID=A0A8H6SGR1_9AGAR|nr:uncharacterized protein MIND_00866800 [Mycena indigotica]KAF7299181.1 hypothetical protein MIND_00866800 [Mycena indigotica]
MLNTHVLKRDVFLGDVAAVKRLTARKAMNRGHRRARPPKAALKIEQATKVAARKRDDALAKAEADKIKKQAQATLTRRKQALLIKEDESKAITKAVKARLAAERTAWKERQQVEKEAVDARVKATKLAEKDRIEKEKEIEAKRQAAIKIIEAKRDAAIAKAEKDKAAAELKKEKASRIANSRQADDNIAAIPVQPTLWQRIWGDTETHLAAEPTPAPAPPATKA